MTKYKIRFISAILVVLCLATQNSLALYDPNFPEFSNPDKIVKLRNIQQWKNKTIRYSVQTGKVDLYISLDQQQYPYLQPLIQQYATQKGLKIKIDNGTCGVSAGLLRRKVVDMGGFCCPPGKLDRLPGLTFHTLGIASLAIIANKTVPVNNLTAAQARQVFNGEITQWSELNNGQKSSFVNQISPIVRPHCKKRPGHWRLITANSKDFANRRFEVGAIPDMIKLTADKPGAIGYETLSMISQFDEKSTLKILTIDGIHPGNNKALAKGDYPFYRTYSITTWEDSPKRFITQALIRWLKQKIQKDTSHTLVSTDALKKNGWIFTRDELTGSPGKEKLFNQRN